MAADQVVVNGILKPDGTLELDVRPSLPPGPVQVTVQRVAAGSRRGEADSAEGRDGGAIDPVEGWSEEKNARRGDLIDRKIEGTLTEDERAELDALQRQAMAYRERVAPLPMAGARALHRELLEKKRRSEAEE